MARPQNSESVVVCFGALAHLQQGHGCRRGGGRRRSGVEAHAASITWTCRAMAPAAIVCLAMNPVVSEPPHHHGQAKFMDGPYISAPAGEFRIY